VGLNVLLWLSVSRSSIEGEEFFLVVGGSLARAG